jgi:hypothetical protein
VQDGEHEHDSTVSSVGIEAEGELDFRKLNTWLGHLLQVAGLA